MIGTTEYFLSHGAHQKAADGRCAMEWVSYLAGERHSDHPVCVSPVLTRFCIAFNDRLPDAERQKLRPYLARTIGTRDDGMDDERIQMCREWLLHTALPTHLDRAGRREAAQKLRELPASLTVEATQRALSFARDEAYAARKDARARLTARVRAELARRGFTDAAAVAAAAADADAVADAVAAAAAAAAADADADADAVAVAVAAAVAAAAADADADADVVVDGSSGYWAVYNAVRDKLRERWVEIIREQNADLTAGAFDLLERMLPTELIQLPVVEDAAAVCGVPVGAA